MSVACTISSKQAPSVPVIGKGQVACSAQLHQDDLVVPVR